MIERLLYIVDAESYSDKQWDFVKKFAKLINTRLFAIRFVNKLKGKEEDRAWEVLYSIEDDAFGEEIKISLFVEKKSEGKLRSIINAYDINMVVMHRNSGYIKTLKGINIPVLLLPKEV